MQVKYLLLISSVGILILALMKKHLDMTKEFKDHLTGIQKQMNDLKEHINHLHSEYKKEVYNIKEELKEKINKSNSKYQSIVQNELSNMQTEVISSMKRTLKTEIKGETQKLLQDIKTLDMELYSSLGIARCLPCNSDDLECIPCNMTWKDCADVYKSGHTKSGVYRIKAGNLLDPVSVYCEASNGGGWTVFQRRVDNSISFERKWQDYKTGFGDPRGSHWLGNDILAAITSGIESYTLRIDLVNFSNEEKYAEYDSFQVRPEIEKYKLIIVPPKLPSFSVPDSKCVATDPLQPPMGVYDGDTGDGGTGLSHHHDMDFSTVDMDNDQHPGNCASKFHGGWWYKRCHYVNLNGAFTDKRINSDRCMTWYAWDQYHSLKNSEMKLRPTGYSETPYFDWSFLFSHNEAIFMP